MIKQLPLKLLRISFLRVKNKERGKKREEERRRERKREEERGHT